MKGDYTKDALQAAEFIRQTSERRCTDCGRPTHNYRCEKCWKKRRGFGFEGSGEGADLQRGDAAALRRAIGEARKRREKPAPFIPDTFVPLSPRPALPDRQAEFFAKREKKMKQQTYTVNELAALLGMAIKDVRNAKQFRTGTPRPGTKLAAVRDGMTAHGITWDQVIVGTYEKKPDVEAASIAPAPVVESAPPAPVAALADAVTDMEPGDTPSPATESVPLGQSTAKSRPLEEIFEELRHRLPGAAVIITLQ